MTLSTASASRPVVGLRGQLLFILGSLGALTLMLTLLRGALLAWNWELAAEVSRGDLLEAFFNGLRFDLRVVVIVGAPMYNFTIPSQLKAWLDRLGVPGVTFQYSEAGPEGLAGGRKVVIASARGGEYSTDQLAENQESLLTTFFGFIGVDDLHFVRVEKAGFGPEAIEQGMKAAKQEIAKL